MKRLHQPWLALGMALACASGPRFSHGQTNGQETPTPTYASTQASPQAITQAPGRPLTSFPTGAATFPRGYQSPREMIQSASPQSGHATPYGSIPDQRPSGQVLTAPATLGAPFAAPGQSAFPSSGEPSTSGGPGESGARGDGGAAYPFSLDGSDAGESAGMLGSAAAYPGSEAAGAANLFEPAAAGAAGAGGFAPALAGLSGPGGAGAAESRFTPNMIGDMLPVSLRAMPAQAAVGPPTVGPPPIPGARGASVFYPGVRTIKMSENMSPRPQDRVFYDFNYYNNVNAALNLYDRSPVKNMEVYRHMVGFEKTFDQGRGSFGMRLPIDTLTADSSVPTLQTPTRTATGNLNLFAKYILKQNVQTGSLLSAGLAVSPPTAPGRFAGAPYVYGINDTAFQPFLGYILNLGDFYIQGFSAFSFTSSAYDVTMMFNDVGIGYYAYRASNRNALVSAVVPTFEVHVNSPFTHRDWKNRFDAVGTADVVNLTYGLNVQLQRSAMLSTALVTPVTGPRPFEAEFAVFLNIFYGRSRAGLVPIQPPPVL